MSSRPEVAVVIGVGPEDGLGGTLCKRFAGRGMHVFVAGRTEPNLDALVRTIEAGGGQATAHVSDATSESDTAALFDAASAAGDLRLAIYNAGNNFAGRVKDMDAAYFEACWRVCCFGGFLFGREAVRRMAKMKRGSVLFTGASASMRGGPTSARSTPPRAPCATSPRRLPRKRGRTASTSAMWWWTAPSAARRSSWAPRLCREARRRGDDQPRRHRRRLRVPARPATHGVVVRGGYAHLRRAVVGPL